MPLLATTPSVWLLLILTLRLLPVPWAVDDALGRYDASLRYRVELVEACAAATVDRSERYLCVKVPRFESAYREDVGRCALRGPQGVVTAWQVIPRSRAERDRLCVSLVEDARYALERIRESRLACRHLPKAEQLAAYARGSCASAEGRELSRHRFPSDAEVRRLETERWGEQ